MKTKRKRIRTKIIGSDYNVNAIQTIANECNVSYKKAYKAYNRAKLYVATFKDKSLLEVMYGILSE